MESWGTGFASYSMVYGSGGVECCRRMGRIGETSLSGALNRVCRYGVDRQGESTVEEEVVSMSRM